VFKLNRALHKINDTISNPNHLGLSIEQAIAESLSGDRCVICKLKGSGFKANRCYLVVTR
jgi:hypothetical protein